VSVHPWHDVPLSPDGDPLDVLVLCREALVPGTLLRARAVGVMRMRDEKGQDDKLMAVPVDDPEHAAAPPARAAPLLPGLQGAGRGRGYVRGAPRGGPHALPILKDAIARDARDEKVLAARRAFGPA
jgi:inorganic pyrophosphatase